MKRILSASTVVFCLCLLYGCGGSGGAGGTAGTNGEGGATSEAPPVKNEVVVTSPSGARENLLVKHAHFSSNTMEGKDEGGNDVVWPTYTIVVSNQEWSDEGRSIFPQLEEGEKRIKLTIYGAPGGDRSSPPKTGSYPASSGAQGKEKAGTSLQDVEMSYLEDGSSKQDPLHGLKGSVKVTSATPEAITVEVEIQSNDGRKVKGSFKAEKGRF